MNKPTPPNSLASPLELAKIQKLAQHLARKVKPIEDKAVVEISSKQADPRKARTGGRPSANDRWRRSH